VSTFLPYGRQSIDEADIAAVAAVLRSEWLTGGPAVAAFENAFSVATGAKHAVACASGTAALHLAALALGLGPGDYVVVPNITFLATANAVRFVGAEVVFADVDPNTGLMTPDTLAGALDRAKTAGQKVSAVFPVHLAGQMADMDDLAVVAGADCRLVEDACHALGATDGEKQPTGSCRKAAMACFSLHPVKVIAGGEGGVVTTNDDELARRLRLARNHGMERNPARFLCPEQAFAPSGDANPWYYEMTEPGFNYRLSDIHAALAASQLGKLKQFVGRRAALVARYDELLTPLAPVVRPIRRVDHCTPAWHLYVALVDFAAIGIDRAAFMRQLRDAGIGTQVHYLPLNRQPYYRVRYGDIELAGGDRWYARALSLPLFPAMSDADADRVVGAIRNIVEGRL
jgi:UDP-4-amino-4,6-dideoxy-N-acetyl-beta-L-altrosamine transaminase